MTAKFLVSSFLVFGLWSLVFGFRIWSSALGFRLWFLVFVLALAFKFQISNFKFEKVRRKSTFNTQSRKPKPKAENQRPKTKIQNPKSKIQNEKAPSLLIGLGLRGKRSLWAQITPSLVPLMMFIMGDGLRIITKITLPYFYSSSTVHRSGYSRALARFIAFSDFMFATSYG